MGVWQDNHNPTPTAAGKKETSNPVPTTRGQDSAPRSKTKKTAPALALALARACARAACKLPEVSRLPRRVQGRVGGTRGHEVNGAVDQHLHTRRVEDRPRKILGAILDVGPHRRHLVRMFHARCPTPSRARMKFTHKESSHRSRRGVKKLIFGARMLWLLCLVSNFR